MNHTHTDIYQCNYTDIITDIIIQIFTDAYIGDIDCVSE